MCRLVFSLVFYICAINNNAHRDSLTEKILLIIMYNFLCDKLRECMHIAFRLFIIQYNFESTSKRLLVTKGSIGDCRNRLWETATWVSREGKGKGGPQYHSDKSIGELISRHSAPSARILGISTWRDQERTPSWGFPLSTCKGDSLLFQ